MRTPLTASTAAWRAYLAADARVRALPDDSGPLKPSSVERHEALLQRQYAIVRLVATMEER